MSNPCTRCGNERIASKPWKEVIETYGRTSIVIHTQYVCVDPKCQEIVEHQFATQKKERESVENQRKVDKVNRAKHTALGRKQSSKP